MGKLVLWDFDGPVVNSLGNYYDFYNLLCRHFNVKKQWDGFEGFRNWVSGDWKDHTSRLGLAEKLDESDKLYKKHRKEHPSELQDGILEIIRAERKYKQAVFSSAYTPEILAFLNKHGLLSAFNHVPGSDKPAIFGGDNMLDPKPLSSALEEVRGYFDASPEDTFYVADTETDIKLSQIDGSKIIAVTFGWHPKARLEKLNPDYLAETPRELGVILNSL
jgi:phosphoglycolate phosphatase-like HAD superfamily hydrolase